MMDSELTSLRLLLRGRALTLRYPLSPWLAKTQPSKVDRAEIRMNHRRHKAMRFEKLL